MERNFMKDNLIFSLLLIFWLLILIVIFSTSYNVNFINYLLFSALILNMLIAYNLRIVAGLITSLFLVFGYGSYLLYSIIVLNTISEFKLEYAFWLVSFPVGAFLSGSLEREFRVLKERLREFEEREKLVLLDDVTGFYNPFGFFQRLEEEIKRAQRYKETFSILYINIVDWKELKNIYGEDGYKSILRVIANEILKNTRTTDIKGRIEDGVLGIILPDADINSVKIVKEKLHRALDKIIVEIGGKRRVISLKIKIGEAEFQEGEDTLIIWERAKDSSKYDV